MLNSMDVDNGPHRGKTRERAPMLLARAAGPAVALALVVALSSSAVMAQVGSWTIGSITTGGDTNNFVAVTTDSAGNFHGAWRPESGSAGYIQIGAWNGSSWTVVSSFNTSSDSPDIFDSFSDDVSVAIDSVGDYHVAFRASRGGGTSSTRGVFYAKYDVSAATWMFEEVQTGSHPSGFRGWNDPFIDVDSSDVPHIAFQYSNADSTITPPRPQYLRYAGRSGGSWSTDDIDTANCSTGDCYEISCFGFALDSADKAHIVYGKERGDQYDADLMYATNAAGSFATQVLKDVGDGQVSGPGVGDADIEIDGNDSVHISYSVGDFGANSIRHITDAGGSFAEDTAVGNGNHGYPNRIGVNADGSIKLIAYGDSDSSPSSVRAASKVGSAAWQDEQVFYNAGDSFGTGSFMDAIMNDSGEIMILFHRNSDSSNNDRRVMFAYGSLAASVCGNGAVEGSEQCDDGNTSNGDCCSSTCTFESAGSNCGASPTECSGQDTCDGAGACQPNHLAAGTHCGDAGTECVNQDTCNGSGTCVDNGFVTAGAACGDPTVTDCDGADTCDGQGSCDANLAADGTSCDDSDVCSTTDSCAAGVCVGGPDQTDPLIDCSGINPTQSADAGFCNFTMPGTGFDASFSDNCPGATIVNDFNSSSSLAGETFDVGTTSVMWTVTDGAGATASCTVDIVITDDEPPVADCSGIVATRSADPGLCTFTMPGTGFDAMFSDNCPGASIVNDYNSGDSLAGETFDVGTTSVMWTVTDAAGATASCTVDIVITDDEAPTITCPADIEEEPTGTTGTTVSYDDPSVADNCPGVTFDCSPASGSLFGFGDTIVTCTATDDAGNGQSCSFTVTVLEADEVIDNLIDAVTALRDAGTINGGQENALIRKLEHALENIGRLNGNVTCNTLDDFISQVMDLIDDGVLTSAEGQPLIDSASNVRAALGCMMPLTAIPTSSANQMNDVRQIDR